MIISFLRILLFGAIIPALSLFANASQIWNSLDGSTQIAFRAHLTEEQVQQNRHRFPALFTFWDSFPEKFSEELQNSDPVESAGASNALQEIQEEYGFSVESFLQNLRGEMGIALHGQPLANMDNEETAADIQLLVWLTPDKGTKELFPQLRSYLEVELKRLVTESDEEVNPDAEETDLSVSVEELEFMGHPAIYVKSYQVASDWEWIDEESSVQEVVSYRPIQVLAVSTPAHILLQINIHQDSYNTTDWIEDLVYGAESFAYLGRTLYGSQSPEKEFLRKFAGNPAVNSIGSQAPLWEAAVDVAYFANILKAAHQQFVNASNENGDESGVPPFVQKMLTMDWVGISGLPLVKTFYAAADFTSKGGELYAGIEGDFAAPGQNNLLKLYLEPADGGIRLPSWVPVNAQSFGSTSVNISKAYDYLQEQLTLQTGSAWTTFIAMQEPLIRQITGFGVQDYFHSFGSTLYLFSFNPVAPEEDSDDQPFVPQAFILTMKDTMPAHALIQHIVMTSGGQISPQQRQDFTVWNFEGESEKISLLYNKEYLIVSNAESITDHLVHQISRAEGTQSEFFQRDDIRSLLKEVDIPTSSSLNIASGLNSNKLYEGIWNDLEGEIEDFLPMDLLSFRILLYSVKSMLQDEIILDLGAGINTGRLVQSGYLIHTIQHPRTRDE